MGDMSNLNQSEVEAVVSRIDNMMADPQSKMIVETILVTNPHISGDQIVFIKTSNIPTPLVSSGITTFKNRQEFNSKIKQIVKGLIAIGIDPSNRFILHPEKLPIKSGIYNKTQDVWRITHRGFISLFMHIKSSKAGFALKEKAVDAITLVIDVLILLNKMGHTDLIVELSQYNSAGAELVAKAADLFSLQSGFSFKGHMEMLEEMKEFGMNSEFDA